LKTADIDNKRSRDQILNFRNGSAGFSEGFAFVLIALYYPTTVIRDRLTRDRKAKARKGAQIAIQI
jgi:hypothetical protein